MGKPKTIRIFLIVILVLGLALLGYGIYSMITLKTMTKACENDKECNFMKNMNAYGSLAIGLLLVLFAGGFYLYQNAKFLQYQDSPNRNDKVAKRKAITSTTIIMFVILGIIGLTILGFGIYALASKSEDCKTNKECNTIGDMFGYGAVAVGAVISFVSAVIVYKFNEIRKLKPNL